MKKWKPLRNESVTEAFLLFPIVFEPSPVTAPAIIASHPVDELTPCIRDIQVTAFLEVPRMFFDANFRH